jgi:hypothetical protein
MTVHDAIERALDLLEHLEAHGGAAEGGGAPPDLPALDAADRLLRDAALGRRAPGQIWVAGPRPGVVGAPSLVVLVEAAEGYFFGLLVSTEAWLATERDVVIPPEASPTREPLVVLASAPRPIGEQALRHCLGELDATWLERLEELECEDEEAAAIDDELDELVELRLEVREALFRATEYLVEGADEEARRARSAFPRLVVALEERRDVAPVPPRRPGLFSGFAAVGALALPRSAVFRGAAAQDGEDRVERVVQVGEVVVRLEVSSQDDRLALFVEATSGDVPAEGVKVQLWMTLEGDAVFDETRTTNARGAIVPFLVADDAEVSYSLELRSGAKSFTVSW